MICFQLLLSISTCAATSRVRSVGQSPVPRVPPLNLVVAREAGTLNPKPLSP